jgi:hypothetical protein
MEPLELLVKVVVAQRCDRQKALKACVHVAVKTVVLEANDSLLQLFVMLLGHVQ